MNETVEELMRRRKKRGKALLPLMVFRDQLRRTLESNFSKTIQCYSHTPCKGRSILPTPWDLSLSLSLSLSHFTLFCLLELVKDIYIHSFADIKLCTSGIATTFYRRSLISTKKSRVDFWITTLWCSIRPMVSL